MGLPDKDVTCDYCGHTFLSDRRRDWCEKCGRPVFQDAKSRREHKLTKFVVILGVAGVFGFIAYIFIEMIVEPLMR